MRSLKMSWFLILIFFLSFKINVLSEARHVKRFSSAVVVGTVYCDTCFQEGFSKTSHFISGASVLVECKDGSSRPTFQEEVKTDEHGQFKVHLPFSVSKHVKKIKGCSVKLISSSEPYCAVASSATSSSLHLKSRKQGTHIFSAGFFTFKPLKQPFLCNQKPSLQNSKELNSRKTLIPARTENPTFPPPLQDPTTPPQYQLPPLPPLPNLPPLPQLPPLPPLPGFPYLPPMLGKTTQPKPAESFKAAQSSKQKVPKEKFFFPIPPIFPPNPLQPPSIFPPNPLQPPSIFPPNPFQPPSIFPPNPFQPPPLLPPNPFQPPPAPLIPLPPMIPLPPIPGLNPPSPPPPSFPFPLPPFPSPPGPHFPGIPPASTSEKSSP